jgi:three-Cys-motif partner protein
MEDEFFLRDDTSHSFSKRDLLKGTIASVIARRLHSLDVFSNDRYAMTYLDAFAGRGSFGTEDDSKVVSFDYDQVTKWGTPIVAIGVTLDHMNNLMNRDSTQTEIKSFELKSCKCLKSIQFFFNDASEENITELSRKIDVCFRLRHTNWKRSILPSSDLEKCVRVVEYKGPFLAISQSIEIHFTTYKFEEMSVVKSLQTPLFSLVDPFGIKQIPMEIVRLLIGDGKEFYINFMVATLNR